MKKALAIIMMVFGFAVYANAQCEYARVSSVVVGDPNTYGEMTITVKITMSGTPTDGDGTYTFSVVPTNRSISSLLSSQRQSADNLLYKGKWEDSTIKVTFKCSLEDGTMKQCRAHDFMVESCYKKN